MKRVRQRRRTLETDEDLDLTPMIDIVFILLIFFIVTASFTKEWGIDVNKQSTRPPPLDTEAVSILVEIDSNSQIRIAKRIIDIRAVRANIERLRAKDPQASVIVDAHEGSRNGVLIEVMDAARQAGVPNVSLAANTMKE